MRPTLLNIILSLIIFPLSLYSQCDATTPTFTVNLTGVPSGTWVSPSVVRDGTCCDQAARCIKIVVTLDPQAAGITFNVASGANPGGALAYEINCVGPPTPSGGPICLAGGQTYTLTFCKVGNNQNTYALVSIPKAVGGTDATINDGCSKQLFATGFNPATVSWTSIFPGAPGAYNGYMSSTTSVSPTVTGTNTSPPYVDYKVCGQPAAQCNFGTVCDTVRVFFNPNLFVNIVPINPTICFGQTSTTLTANGVGGTPPYSYLWNNVNPSQTINVGVGTYNVQLTDGSGCPPVFNQVTVTAFSVAITANAGANQTRCIQSPLATLNGTVTGASGGIWSGGTGTFSPNNTTLSNITYSPTATELSNGSVNLILTTTGNGTCPPKTDTVKITYLPFTGIVTPSVTNVSCFGGSNGTAIVNLSGGITPYTYLWNTSPTQTTSSIGNLPIGTYSVTVRDGIGCTFPTTVNITQPPILAINGTVTNVSCNGGSTGSITSSPTGGTLPYSYLWNPGGQTAPTATNLAAGNYSLTVTDGLGCTRTATYVVTQPLPITATLVPTNVSCFNGSNGAVTTTVAGGTSAYSYSWNPGGATSQNVTGLIAGTYTLTITDVLNCIATKTVTITQPPLLVASTTVTNETCNYLNNGSATASQTGGTSGFTYSWSPGGQTSATISGLASGTYTVVVTDSKGCQSTALAVIAEPTPLVVGFINQVNVSCFGGSNGSVGASPSGGTPNYTYSWTPGGSTNSSLTNIPIGTYTVKVTDNNSCIATNTVTIIQPTDIVTTNTIVNVSCNGGSNGSISITPTGGVSPYTYVWSAGGQTTSSVTGLPIGSYSVTVTDANGCQKNYAYTITQPLPIAIAFTQTNVSCFNGSNGAATSTVTGGTPAYSYSWSPGGATSQNVTGLIAGTYTLTITDFLNCISTNTVTITQPPLLVASTTVTNETCNYLNNGSATASQTGGTSGFTYSWSPGGQTSATISGLASGTYTVVVTDSKGCQSTALAVITEPTPLVIGLINQVNVSCFGGSNGSVGASPSGGTPNYTYSWTPGGSTNSSLTNIPIGTYTIQVTDNNSCIATNTVTIIQPTDIVTTNTIINVSCNGGSDGGISITPTGGVSPYTYVWSAGGQTTSSVTGLPIGSYSVTVTDANGCQKNYAYSITQPLPLAIAFTQTNVSCFNGSNGAVTTTVTGGTAAYSYSWSPGGATSQNVTGLIAGTYTLTVTDFLNCIAINTVTITQPPLLVASTTVTNETCNYLNNGSASASQTGGTSGFTYSWSPGGQTSATISGLASGTYTVVVTDSKGCQSTALAVITEPTPLVVGFINQVNVSCFGGSNASIGASPSGGTPNYTYLWSPGGSTTNSLFNIPAGTYTVLITDNNNCTVQNTIAITQPTAALNVSATSVSITCNGGSDGSATGTASGGTPGYSYSWMPGTVSGQTISNVTSGIYSVTATDLNGCIHTNTVFVNQPAPILPVTTSTNSTCGNSNGIGSVSVTGGVGPYTYSWMPSGGTSSVTTGVPAGVYSVSVTDANNCVAIELLSLDDNSGPNSSIFSITNVSCYGGNDGSATAQVIGGVAPITYTWFPSGGNGITATGLTAGTYYIIAEDANGCASSAITSPHISQPPPIVETIITTSISCFGGTNGTATVSAAGGTPGYTYTWMPGSTTGSVVTGLSVGVFSVQIKDTHNCVHTATYSISQPAASLAATASSNSVSCFGGSNGAVSVNASGGTTPYNYNWMPGNLSGQSISNLTAGTYTSTVSDINNCTTTATVTVIQPTAIVLTTGSINSNCGAANGQASVSASGGIPGYSYSWTPNGGTNSTAGGLLAGNYTVQVTDANSCVKTTTQTVADNPGPAVSIISTTSVTCNGGSNATATASVTGGTGPFTYTWSPIGGNSATGTGLTAGIYTVYITAGNGCLANAVTPSITQPTLLFSNITTSNVSCFGGNNGTA
ncbi:MAG: hypothetical protein K0S26_2565, partial [Bacteroidota bacterium]|nr:hypothetical protein [Bacteroidota bacterium]